MHLAIRQANSNQLEKSQSIRALWFVERKMCSFRFVKFINKKSLNFYEMKKDIKLLLKQIHNEHRKAMKLENELEHEKTVLEERLQVNLDWFE